MIPIVVLLSWTHLISALTLTPIYTGRDPVYAGPTKDSLGFKSTNHLLPQRRDNKNYYSSMHVLRSSAIVCNFRRSFISLVSLY